MEISDGVNGLAEQLSRMLGGAGDIDMEDLADEIDDSTDFPNEEEGGLHAILENVAEESGDDYNQFEDVRMGDADIDDMQFDDDVQSMTLEGLSEDERNYLAEVGMGLESGEINAEDLENMLQDIE